MPSIEKGNSLNNSFQSHPSKPKKTYDLWYSKHMNKKNCSHTHYTSATLKHSNHSCPPTCTARRSDLCGSMLLAKRWFNRRAKERRRVDTKCLAVRWRSYLRRKPPVGKMPSISICKLRMCIILPSRELTYPTLGKGKSSSKCHFWGIC